jgi:hypothetical protein
MNAPPVIEFCAAPAATVGSQLALVARTRRVRLTHLPDRGPRRSPGHVLAWRTAADGRRSNIVRDRWSSGLTGHLFTTV